MTLAEQYRPVRLEDIVGQPVDEITSRLNGRNTPNFLLFGPPGTGKTTAARCIAREVQNEENAYVELNAADVGVDGIRGKVDRAGRRLTLTGSLPVVILDEMETMGYKAQQSLKKRMEDYPAIFVLLTNDTTLDDINAALVDRCKVVEFGSIPNDAIKRRLRAVAQKEGIDVNEAEIEHIVSFSNGSLRTALQRLGDYRTSRPEPEYPWEEEQQPERETDGGDTPSTRGI